MVIRPVDAKHGERSDEFRKGDTMISTVQQSSVGFVQAAQASHDASQASQARSSDDLCTAAAPHEPSEGWAEGRHGNGNGVHFSDPAAHIRQAPGLLAMLGKASE
jgi:hypothetical protein